MRSRSMLYRTAAISLAIVGLLPGCDRPEQPVPEPTAAAVPSVEAVPTATSSEPVSLPQADPGLATSRDPRRVVIAWAQAMSLKDWDTAYRFWGDNGERSGLSIAEFRAKWSKVADPQFDIAEGQSEGAAGSLYYTAPVTLVDGKRRVPGEIVLRRANDVPGATADQLRWHIERLELEP